MIRSILKNQNTQFLAELNNLNDNLKDNDNNYSICSNFTSDDSNSEKSKNYKKKQINFGEIEENSFQKNDLIIKHPRK